MKRRTKRILVAVPLVLLLAALLLFAGFRIWVSC